MSDPIYGHDLSCLPGTLNLAMQEVDGIRTLAEALVRRLNTPRGGLLYDPNYGFDLLQFADADLSTREIARIGASVDAELVKDERVKLSSTSGSFANGTLVLTTSIIPLSGKAFTLVVAANGVTVELLRIPA